MSSNPHNKFTLKVWKKRLSIILAVCLLLLLVFLSKHLHCSWLIDYPIYGIRLGDDIKNIPEGFTIKETKKLDDGLLDFVMFDCPSNEIKNPAVAIYKNKYIASISVSIKESSFESYLKAIEAIESNHKILHKNKYEPKNANFSEDNVRNTAGSASYNIEIDRREVSVDIYWEKKSKMFPDGNINISYAHTELGRVAYK